MIISFDTETSCGGKEAEIIQLAAQTEQGQTFSRFVLPKKGISFHASRVIVGEPRPKNEGFVHPSPQKMFDSGLLLFDNS